jgi:hypothetical protein
VSWAGRRCERQNAPSEKLFVEEDMSNQKQAGKSLSPISNKPEPVDNFQRLSGTREQQNMKSQTTEKVV